mgnify:CR=1 FL=1
MDYINDDYVKKYEPFWGSWYIEKSIGQGSFGKVYKIYKEEWGYKYESALKIMSIPTSEQYHEAISTIGNDENLLKLYFEDAVKSIINEIVLLYNLRGNSNIVSYEDHTVQKHKDEIAWDILIRMEYLTPLNKYVEENDFSIDDVVNIGLDICAALELCSKKNIVHRDIKDENIFVSKDKRYKLGDFGIARELSKGLSASIRGTPLYIAPEIYRGTPYDTRADLYSLGILLYKLLNNGRFPFMPPFPTKLSIKDSEIAVEKRLIGEPMPPPTNTQSKLGNVILKLCEYKPENRFSSPSKVKDALIEACYEMSYIERQKIVLSKKKTNTLQPSDTILETVLLNNNEASENDAQPIVNSQTPTDSNKDNYKSLYIINKNTNIPSNIINGGLVYSNKNWIYLSCPEQKFNIYKISPDETQITKLTSDECWFINVVNDQIYYCNSLNNESIYRINIDGTHREKVIANSCWYLNVDRNWMYYCNESDGNSIYKARTNGSEKIKLSSDKASKLSLYEGFLYYCSKSDSNSLYRIDTNGNDKTKISDDEISYFCIYDKWIYYSNKSDNMNVYKMNTSTAIKEKICNDMSTNINIYDDWIYYCNKSDMSKLYRIRIDGTDREKLNDDYCDYISVVDDWIFYCNQSDQNKIYKMRPNGLNKTKINISKNIEEWIYI